MAKRVQTTKSYLAFDATVDGITYRVDHLGVVVADAVASALVAVAVAVGVATATTPATEVPPGQGRPREIRNAGAVVKYTRKTPDSVVPAEQGALVPVKRGLLLDGGVVITPAQLAALLDLL